MAPLELLENDKSRIKDLGRIGCTGFQLHYRLQEKAIVNIPDSASELGINRATIANCMNRLEGVGIVKEITVNRRNRLFIYDQYLQLLSEGTEPILS